MSSQHLRGSQFIFTYGPGAILEGRHGPRIIPRADIGLDPNIDLNRFEILDRRISNALLDGGRVYRLPSNAELERSDDQYIYRTRPFPEWKLCVNTPEHREGTDYILHTGRVCPVCNRQNTGERAVRFVAACPRGHLDEVNWKAIAHGEGSACRQGEYFIWKSDGSGLRGIKILCPACGSYGILGAAYSAGWPCSGRRPENKKDSVAADPDGCRSEAKIMPRQAANIRIPITRTIFTVPPISTSLHRDLQHRQIFDAIDYLEPDTEKAFEHALSKAVERGLGDTVADRILRYDWEQINGAIQDIMQAPPRSFAELLSKEFDSLKHVAAGETSGETGSDRQVPEFLFEADPDRAIDLSTQRGASLRVTPINRLEAISVQIGYRREVGNIDERAIVRSACSINGDDWFPGNRLSGEGILVTSPDYPTRIRGNAATRWMRAFTSNRYANSSGLFRNEPETDELHPGFVWWHTLSHLLIRAIAGETGYTLASIRERIYFEYTSTSIEGAILLYSVQPGADASMGGLVSLVDDSRFQRILHKVLEHVEVCSADPVCLDRSFEIGRVNGSACYGCLLLPETCCEHRNFWLDRNIYLENPL